MVRVLILGIVAVLVGCSEPAPRTHAVETEDGKQVQVVESRPGFGEQAMGSAIAGAAAGTAGTLAHHATNHAVNKYRAHRARSSRGRR